jgi:hypothetical protein
MVLSWFLLSRRRARIANNIEGRSLRLKVKLLTVNIVSFVIAGYFFVRHNSNCEPYGRLCYYFLFLIVKLTLYSFQYTPYLPCSST